MMYGGTEAELQAFLNLALNGCGQLHAPNALPQGEIDPGIPLIGSWVGSRARLDAVAKKKHSCPSRELNSGRPARNSVTTLTELHLFVILRVARTIGNGLIALQDFRFVSSNPFVLNSWF
jgi:hypothetical protein